MHGAEGRNGGNDGGGHLLFIRHVHLLIDNALAQFFDQSFAPLFVHIEDRDARAQTVVTAYRRFAEARCATGDDGHFAIDVHENSPLLSCAMGKAEPIHLAFGYQAARDCSSLTRSTAICGGSKRSP